jgi:hypothetical protein
VGAELPDADVPEANPPDPPAEDVAAVPLLEGGAEEPDAALAPVFPAPGIETPILPASSAAVRANRLRKSADAALRFEAVPAAAADNPAPEDEVIEVR